jgi:5-methylcytosine-specific restriction endonuclease McrA
VNEAVRQRKKARHEASQANAATARAYRKTIAKQRRARYRRPSPVVTYKIGTDETLLRPLMGNAAAIRSWGSYDEYLRSPHWKETRKAFLLVAGTKRCFVCKRQQRGLHVHHCSYERLGAELAVDLVLLCRGCHAVLHRRFDTKDKEALRTAHVLMASERK